MTNDEGRKRKIEEIEKISTGKISLKKFVKVIIKNPLRNQ